MKFTSFVGFALAVLTISANAAPINNDQVDINAVPDSYLVLFKDNTNTTSIKAHEKWVDNVVVKGDKLAKRGTTYGVRKTFNINGLTGYSATLTGTMLTMVKGSSQIAKVEVNRKVFANAVQKNATPGLARVSHREPLTAATKAEYLFDEKAGEGVTIYVVDTGVFAEHEDFEGRATNGFNAIDGEEDVDLNGHGTHCSATAAGKKFGVAKKAQVVGVKVLDAQGAGDNAGVIKGIEFAVAEHEKKAGKAGFKGSVISMSLGGGKSAVVDQAVDKATAAGVTVVVAAGNENADACNTSPGGAPNAVTVGATDDKDVRANFSNFGKCVDVFAVGVDVQSAGIKNPKDSVVFSGTSQATPHVSGVAATFMSLSDKPMTPKEVSDKITQTATPDILKQIGAGSPNLLAFNDFDPKA